ncbi:MAG: hypothetical protein ACYTBJ_00025 [Planctomycetota bacterium]
MSPDCLHCGWQNDNTVQAIRYWYGGIAGVGNAWKCTKCRLIMTADGNFVVRELVAQGAGEDAD